MGKAATKTVTKEGIIASLGRVEAAFKLRYMGLGFVWAWLYCSYSTSALFSDSQGLSINTDGSWLVSVTMVVLTFLVGGVVLSLRSLRGERTQDTHGGHIQDARGERPQSARNRHASTSLCVIAPVLLAVGTVFSAWGAFGSAFSWVGGALTGVGYALLSMMWACALLSLDVEELEVVIPLSSLVVVPCVLVFPLFQGAIGVMATALLPLMSGVLLLLCVRDGTLREAEWNTHAQECADSSVKSTVNTPTYLPVDPAPHPVGNTSANASVNRAWLVFLLRAQCVLCVLCAAIGCRAALADVHNELHAAVGIDVSMLVSSLAAVALGVAIVFFSKKVSFTELFRWAVPFTVIALVLEGSADPWANAGAGLISDTLYALIRVCVFLFVITMAKAGKVPVCLGIGLVNGFTQLSSLLGNVVGSASTQAVFLSPPSTVALLVCVVALAGVLAPQREPVDESPAFGGADSVATSMLVACEHMQKRFGLSERETEVAFLLAQGRSRPYIREKLFISKNTVSTHVKHVYRKLDVHSREELIDLVSALTKEA